MSVGSIEDALRAVQGRPIQSRSILDVLLETLPPADSAALAAALSDRRIGHSTIMDTLREYARQHGLTDFSLSEASVRRWRRKNTTNG